MIMIVSILFFSFVKVTFANKKIRIKNDEFDDLETNISETKL